MKGNLRKECYRRVTAVLKTKLNVKKLKAINTLAIPVVTYSLNIRNRNLEDIKRMERKIQKLLTLNRMHHVTADMNRMYVPRQDGGGGIWKYASKQQL